MSTALTPYQTHLAFFTNLPHPQSHQTLRITLPSALRASLSLGLNFPVSLLLALVLRMLYGWSDVRGVSPSSRWHCNLLSDVSLPTAYNKGVTRVQLLDCMRGRPAKYRWRMMGLWAVAADERTGVLSARDVEDVRKGVVYWRVAERRRVRWRDGGNVLPVWRGGPVSVAGHAYFVKKLFGVEVYARGKSRIG